jgi:hypothetical protein
MTSLVIPCIATHLHLINNLLSIYTKQTLIPNEIIVAVSSVTDTHQEIINLLKTTKWPFDLKITQSSDKRLPGGNRYLGTNIATNDIILYQDADDIPHPQLVECIKFFFDNSPAVHIMYCWNFRENGWKKTDNITFEHYIDFSKIECMWNGYPQSWPIMNGACAIKKQVCEKVQWVNDFGEDLKFNYDVSKEFSKTLVLNTVLIHYRNELSVYSSLLKK